MKIQRLSELADNPTARKKLDAFIKETKENITEQSECDCLEEHMMSFVYGDALAEMDEMADELFENHGVDKEVTKLYYGMDNYLYPTMIKTCNPDRDFRFAEEDDLIIESKRPKKICGSDFEGSLKTGDGPLAEWFKKNMDLLPESTQAVIRENA